MITSWTDLSTLIHYLYCSIDNLSPNLNYRMGVYLDEPLFFYAVLTTISWTFRLFVGPLRFYDVLAFSPPWAACFQQPAVETCPLLLCLWTACVSSLEKQLGVRLLPIPLFPFIFRRTKIFFLFISYLLADLSCFFTFKEHTIPPFVP